MDLWGGLWLADYVGAFLAGGGNAVYYFHYLPLEMGAGHHGSQGTFNFFSADKDLKVKQPLAQYFASQLINLEWLQPGSGQHRLFAATGDVTDGVGQEGIRGVSCAFSPGRCTSPAPESVRSIPRQGAALTAGRAYAYCGLTGPKNGDLWNSFLLISHPRWLCCSFTWLLSFGAMPRTPCSL